MKYLIADDNKRFRACIRQLLMRPGDELRELDDGVEVNAVYEEFSPDWVLLDITMKTMNGFEAGTRLKKKYPDARLVLVSNYADEPYTKKAKMIGAEAIVAKESLEELARLVLRS
jgi:two-component system, NarL family, response regulator DegU